MIVSINQPAYLPWLGYFNRIQKSDLHIVLDHVPMGGDGMFNRNSIRTPAGKQLLTVPIKNRGDETPINMIQVAENGKWQRQHLKALTQNYARAPKYFKHIDRFADLYSLSWYNLSELVEKITRYMLEHWEIKTPILYSSCMKACGSKTELNLNLCLEAGATKYISGAGGRDYLDVAMFEKHGIEVEFQDYKHPVYPQCWPGFESHLSAVDALFNLEEFPT